jgi:CxxC-x17-CxxC domain-containing protein
MGNFNNKGRGGSKFGNKSGGFGGGGRNNGGFRTRGFGGRDDRPQMYRATCSDCGNSCEVPFKPTGNKPVFCSECFGNNGGPSSNRSGGRDFGRDKQMFQAICANCGNKCEVPFRPSGDKPVLCSSCFGGNSPAPRQSNEASKEKHDEILAKLDKIINLLQRTNPVKEVTVMKATEEVAEKKAEKKPKKAAAKKKAPARKKAAPKKAAKTKTKAKA